MSESDADLNARWTAWQNRGRANDRAVRHVLTILVPSALVAAAIAYLLLNR